MIDDKHHGIWLKEYLSSREATEMDKETTDQIVRSFRNLWRVARCLQVHTDLTKDDVEALAILKDPLS